MSPAPTPTQPAARPTDINEFYVGYLPAPHGIASAMRFSLLALTLLVAMAGAILAIGQRHPGEGSWDFTLVEKTGVLILMPYPMLIDDETPHHPSILLVEPGKHGSGERLKPFAGQRITLRGTIIQRDLWCIMELGAEESAVQVISPPRDGALATPTRGIAWAGDTEITGEVVDPKCFLGAMRPGDGKAHRACAALCIFGGIPPVLAASPHDDKPRCTLLVAPDGGPANELVLRHAGETVTLRGTLGSIAGWDVLKIAPR